MRTVGILCLPGKCSPDTDGPSSHRILFQKRILEDYAQKNGFTNIRHFTDDGVRGTTFKRPGLDAMLEEIRAGNVATVIIKDGCVIIEPTQKGLENQGFVAGSICF